MTSVSSQPDPQWMERISKSDTGEDFLGLRSVQTNIVGYLLPGIITITPRARYYAFYSWLLVEYTENHPKGWSIGKFIKRREQIFSLANITYHRSLGYSGAIGGLFGTNKLTDHYHKHYDGNTIPLSVDDYIDATYGGYDAYSGVMRELDITAIDKARPEGIGILHKGQLLAKAFSEAIQDTDYYKTREHYDQANSIPFSILQEYGEKCYLNHLDKTSDRDPVTDILFSFDSGKLLPEINPNINSRANMRGTLGVILDILYQSGVPIDEGSFRLAVMFGLCRDYNIYQPSQELRPILAHWQMAQIREYYVYSLYALWEYFLHYLRTKGPVSLRGFMEHIGESIHLDRIAVEAGTKWPNIAHLDISLSDCINALFELAGISAEEMNEERFIEYNQRCSSMLNEQVLYEILDRKRWENSSFHVGGSWLLLCSLYMRLKAIQTKNQWGEWHWAEEGGNRRQSLKLFVAEMDECISHNGTVFDMLTLIFRDAIIAQHTITALEKWHQRNANTFRFNYKDGVFEWARADGTGFSASRFRQAYDMLRDLGLYSIEEEKLVLTPFGEETLERVLKSIND